jgi:hypothetical protein
MKTLSGNTAQLEADGRTFAAIAAERRQIAGASIGPDDQLGHTQHRSAVYGQL